MVEWKMAWSLVVAATLALIPGEAATSRTAGRIELMRDGGFGGFGGNAGKLPAAYTVSGGARFGKLTDANRDVAVWGVALPASSGGRVAQDVKLTEKTAGQWYRFEFRAMPDRDFEAGSDSDLFARAEYFDAAGKSLDGVSKPLWKLVEQSRTDLAANGKFKRDGGETWRVYTLAFRVPFAEVSKVRVSVNLAAGKGMGGGGRETSFLVTDFSMKEMEAPVGASLPATRPLSVDAPSGTMVPLGGRWFYRQISGEPTPTVFNAENADRLYYHDAVWQTPFADNISPVLRAGWKDLSGKIATQDTPVKDAVTIRFEKSSMVIHTANLPNHPTGRFPELRGNPSYITQQDMTVYLPLEPKERAGHQVIDEHNSNGALNMGPIGIATNGVVFFNPFDMGNTDATDMMDRCCGHPQQQGTYHYHKYPVCVNTPFNDEATGHSPLLGFAFDGYPVYGPYEEKGVLAMDATGEKALNGFNGHFDAERGFHYHVTPGRFPYLIGGYWGTADSRDVRRGPPGGGPGGGQGGGPGGGQGRGPGGGRMGPPPGGRPGGMGGSGGMPPSPGDE